MSRLYSSCLYFLQNMAFHPSGVLRSLNSGEADDAMRDLGFLEVITWLLRRLHIIKLNNYLLVPCVQFFANVSHWRKDAQTIIFKKRSKLQHVMKMIPPEAKIAVEVVSSCAISLAQSITTPDDVAKLLDKPGCLSPQKALANFPPVKGSKDQAHFLRSLQAVVNMSSLSDSGEKELAHPPLVERLALVVKDGISSDELCLSTATFLRAVQNHKADFRPTFDQLLEKTKTGFKFLPLDAYTRDEVEESLRSIV